jgi:lipoprotein-releasing system ATP-binding protein
VSQEAIDRRMTAEPAAAPTTDRSADTATGPLLVAEDLEKDYRSGPELVKVLRGVSISLSPGEVVALVGASGIGKTTLLYILGALDRPTGGRVLFDGLDVFTRSESGLARFRRQEIGFVFQFYNLLGEMTALENAMLPALLLRRPRPEAEARAIETLTEVGLGDRLRHRPGELSGGEQQRVAVARALMNRPRLILADEPTGNLDPKTSEVIYDLFLQLQAERGQAFLIATHNQDLARKADRGYRLVEGRARPLE